MIVLLINPGVYLNCFEMERDFSFYLPCFGFARTRCII